MARAELVCHQMFLPQRSSERREALASGPRASTPAILAVGPEWIEAPERVGQQFAVGRRVLVAEDAR